MHDHATPHTLAHTLARLLRSSEPVKALARAAKSELASFSACGAKFSKPQPAFSQVHTAWRRLGGSWIRNMQSPSSQEHKMKHAASSCSASFQLVGIRRCKHTPPIQTTNSGLPEFILTPQISSISAPTSSPGPPVIPGLLFRRCEGTRHAQSD